MKLEIKSMPPGPKRDCKDFEIRFDDCVECFCDWSGICLYSNNPGGCNGMEKSHEPHYCQVVEDCLPSWRTTDPDKPLIAMVSCPEIKRVGIYGVGSGHEIRGKIYLYNTPIGEVLADLEARGVIAKQGKKL